MTFSAQQRSEFSKSIKQEATRLGFYDCGISNAGPLVDDEKRMEDWLGQGLHGNMSYLEKNKEKRYNPQKLVKDAKSVITVLYAYAPKEKLEVNDNFKISNYAYGIDYHKVVKDKLFELLKFIEVKAGKKNARVFVDSAPVLERAWAHKSGLGFIGKNTLLINRKGGSYFFIGQIIIDLELEYEKTIAEKNFCGSCSLCIKACPTDALEPFKLDATKCISYLTIENKEEIPNRFNNNLHDWIFGCDICQEVCPWNRDVGAHNEPLFNLTDELKKMRKQDWLAINEITFNNLFKKSAVMRAGFKGLERNIQFQIKNRE
jgi:epoxyqueuosine reductase